MPQNYALRQSRKQKACEVDPRDDLREQGCLILRVNGYVFDIRLDPDPRDVRMWLAYREGEPWMRGGLEKLWRCIQAEMLTPLGRRHWS